MCDENRRYEPLRADNIAAIKSARPRLNILSHALPDTDLEGSFVNGSTPGDSMWTRISFAGVFDFIGVIPVELVVNVTYKYTTKRPSHLVVFGKDNFHLCSCLRLQRVGLACQITLPSWQVLSAGHTARRK